MNNIVIKGARQNNLRNIDLEVPRNKLVCFVGVSGSGKSTIAFDIIAREGERQYFESLSAFARRYLPKNNRPFVDEISGVSATIVLDQRRIRGNPRSTVGTVTETYTYLRLLYSRVGLPSMDSTHYSFNHPDGFCKKCKGLGRTVEVMIDRILDLDKSLNDGALIPSEWYVSGRQWSIIKATGHFDMDKKVHDFTTNELDLLLNAKPEIVGAKSGVLVDRFTFQGVVHRITHRNTKVHRGPSESDLKYFDFVPCPECNGGRLNQDARAVKLQDLNIGEVATLPLEKCHDFVSAISHPNAESIKPKLLQQLEQLINVGVGYLSLNRSTDTLSGGEAQRVKMARQLGCSLVETIYVLDEPTAGLHQRDVANVVSTLQKLRDQGNTVIIVEHDKQVMRASDYLIEVGPGGGKDGGTIVATGSPQEISTDPLSITGQFLRCTESLVHRTPRTSKGKLVLQNLQRNNLKHINLSIPLGVMTVLTGVSGSGKSSVIDELLQRQGDRVVVVDQQQIGKNLRGCIATYLGIFDHIRKLFASTHKISSSLFSFNSRGACEHCRGIGALIIDMNFLGDITAPCDKCGGKRYRDTVLTYCYRDKTIADILAMTVAEATQFFAANSIIAEPLALLDSIGLGYITLGQGLSTLSGGESQRLKLASRLKKSGEFYILDEPTAGLHDADVEKLLVVLNSLVNNGNTVLIVEHNLNIIRNADWIIDLGPEGGDKGGEIVAQGTPTEISRNRNSVTGKFLNKIQTLH